MPLVSPRRCRGGRRMAGIEAVVDRAAPKKGKPSCQSGPERPLTMEDRMQSILKTVKTSKSSGDVFWKTCSGLLLLQYSQSNFFEQLLGSVKRDMGTIQPNCPSRRVLHRWAQAATRNKGSKKTREIFNDLREKAQTLGAERRPVIEMFLSHWLYGSSVRNNLSIVADALLKELGWVAPILSDVSASPLKQPSSSSGGETDLPESQWMPARASSSLPSSVSSHVPEETSATSDDGPSSSNKKGAASGERRFCDVGIQNAVPNNDCGVQVDPLGETKKGRVGIGATQIEKLQRQCELCVQDITNLEKVVTGLEITADYKLRMESRVAASEATIDRLRAELDASIEGRRADNIKHDIAMAAMGARQGKLEKMFVQLQQSVSADVSLQSSMRELGKVTDEVPEEAVPKPSPPLLSRLETLGCSGGKISPSRGSLAQKPSASKASNLQTSCAFTSSLHTDGGVEETKGCGAFDEDEQGNEDHGRTRGDERWGGFIVEAEARPRDEAVETGDWDSFQQYVKAGLLASHTESWLYVPLLLSAIGRRDLASKWRFQRPPSWRSYVLRLRQAIVHTYGTIPDIAISHTRSGLPYISATQQEHLMETDLAVSQAAAWWVYRMRASPSIRSGVKSWVREYGGDLPPPPPVTSFNEMVF